MHWKSLGIIGQGCLLAVTTANFLDAIRTISAGIAEYQSTGATVWLPLILSHIWRWRKQNLVASMTLCAASTTRCWPFKQLKKGERKFSAPRANR